MCFPGAWLAHRFHGESSWKWQMGRGAGVGMAGTQGTPYFGHFPLSSSPWKSSEHVWMWHLRPWVSGDHGGAAGLAILKAFSSHNDFVTDSRSCDFRFLDSLGCRDGSWGTHPAAPHNKQPHKPTNPIPAATLGYQATINPCPSPSGQTPWGNLWSWGDTLGVTLILSPQGCGQVAPIPSHGCIPCSAQLWHLLLCRWAHPQLRCRSTPVLATSRECWHHREHSLGTRGWTVPGDTRVDSAQGCEHGQCPGK